MRVSQLMSRDVISVSPESTLRQAAEAMRTGDTGFLPVCRDGVVVGAVTDRDLVVRGLALGEDADSGLVAEVMSFGVKGCGADATLEEAARRMEQFQVRRLVVLDERQEMVGVVTLGDLTRALDACKGGEVLETISEPGHSIGQ